MSTPRDEMFNASNHAAMHEAVVEKVIAEHPHDIFAMDRAVLNGLLAVAAELRALRIAVDRVLKGQVYISAAFDRETVESVQASMHKRANASALLTFRQTEVLQLIAEGWGNKEIANLLNVSVKTVEFHRGRIMVKLGAHSAADLIRYAFQSGMLGT